MASAGQTRLPLWGADGEGAGGQPCLPEGEKSPVANTMYLYIRFMRVQWNLSFTQNNIKITIDRK